MQDCHRASVQEKKHEGAEFAGNAEVDYFAFLGFGTSCAKTEWKGLEIWRLEEEMRVVVAYSRVPGLGGRTEKGPN